MGSINRLDSAIARHTNFDPIDLREEIIAQFFDDKIDIIGDILKHSTEPETLGKIMIELLNDAILEAVREAEKSQELDIRQEKSENRLSFYRGNNVYR